MRLVEFLDLSGTTIAINPDYVVTLHPIITSAVKTEDGKVIPVVPGEACNLEMSTGFVFYVHGTYEKLKRQLSGRM